MAEFWFVEIEMPFPLLAPFEELLGETGGIAVSSYETAPMPDPDTATWCLQVLLDAPPDHTAWARRLQDVANRVELTSPVIRSGYLPDQDWVSHTNRLNAPVRCGRFFLHGQHDRDQVPPGSLPLWLEAGLAFGTGRAPSTFGCLLAIEQLGRRRRLPRVLDFGCGSGVLAMAAARLGARHVLAADIDPVAVRVARENALRNGLGQRLHCLVADRPADPRLGGCFDLVLANILAGPLRRMARDLSRRVAPGGHLVLSGLLAREDAGIVTHYRAQGLILQRRIAREGWHSLIFARRSGIITDR